jgi:5-methylcytosine-specific restriction endonuclease McrA
MSRLTDTATIHVLQSFVGYHLGPQHHGKIDINAAKTCTEEQRLSFLPHIFALMPAAAAVRDQRHIEIKPIIIAHLNDISVEPSNVLIDIIKDLCDNYDRTRWSEVDPKLRVRKASISDLRQQRRLYQQIRNRQGARCAVCGTTFSSGLKEETLDHVIPWRLGGDPPGGWNWQILCRRCNGAKDTLFSSCATSEYVNWIFDDLARIREPQRAANFISEKGRYLALTYYRKCQHAGCDADAKVQELHVKKKTTSGFAIFDHLMILCAKHEFNMDGPIIG